jgi:hypothetical protein
MIPLPFGGVRITVQRTTYDKLNDPTYTDHHQIDGCVEFAGTSVTGRGTRSGSEDANVVTDSRTLYAPTGSDILDSDRLLIHPPGMDLIPTEGIGKVIRRSHAYQVDGRPVDWTHGLTGWQPGMELVLKRVY